MKLTTPVVFIIFNRPSTTERVFERIREVQPEKLLVIADGPRPGNSNDEKNCKAAREIIDKVDWHCEVVKNFSDANMGCKRRISSGLDWAFSIAEKAIILEDDCLPHESFFFYCQELLEKYKDDKRVLNISGINLQPGTWKSEYSYYFSRFIHVWGWASWRRAWQLYDVDMKRWPEAREKNLLGEFLDDTPAKAYWNREFRKTYEGRIDTWDHQWTFACWLNKGLTILPSINLVTNIGFGAGASHTTEDDSGMSSLKINEIKFPLKHPEKIQRDKEADRYTQAKYYTQGFFTRLKNKIKSMLK